MSKHYQLTRNINPQIFRAYDIRGVVGETLDEDVVYSIAKSIGTEALAKQQQRVVVARDGRLSGPSLQTALIQGLLDCGCDVIDIGAVPSPVLYFATYFLKTTTGVMLTGSHNPTNFNGLKMMIAGETLTDERITQLYERVQKNELTQGQGKLTTADVIGAYIQRITSEIKLARPLKVVIDCGNGIPGMIAPQLFTALGCEVISLFCDVDGNFPNHHPDPSVPENLQDIIARVKQEQADLGLAFDGDGDRLGVVTETGEIIYPDRQMMLFSEKVLQANPHANIVYDVKCSRFLGETIKKNHGNPIMARTGHSVLKKKMLETNAPLAGELSGHLFFNDRWYGFDDGLYTACRLLEILADENITASELFSRYPVGVTTPEFKINIAENAKFSFMQQFIAKAKFENAELITIDGLRIEFKDGWGLLRVSNTTPCLTARFEADNPASLKRIQADLHQQIAKIDSSLVIPF